MKTLHLKYVTKTKTGSFEYRRQVPQALRDRIGKSEIKKVLGFTEMKAIKAWPAFHEQVELALAVAKQPTGSAAPTQDTIRTAIDIQREAIATLKALGVDPTGPLHSDPDNWGSDAEMLAETFVSKTDADRVAYRMLSGSGNVKPVGATFLDAQRLYIQTKVAGQHDEHRRRLRMARVADFVKKATGKNPDLVTFTRSDAREVVREMLSTGIKPSTVDRYCNDLRAIWAFGILEFELKQMAVNHFVGLQIKGLKVEGSVERDERHPFTPAQLKITRAYILAHAGTELKLIWRILEGTGMRLSEAAGLQVFDVVLGGETPHVDLRFNAIRRLKNTASIRKVPLVGDALAAAREALNGRSGTPDAVFSKYGKKGGGNVASAALMKSVRKVVSDPKIVVHSLRHTMMDKLIVAGVQEHDRSLILGHSRKGEADRYGSDAARLIATARALSTLLPKTKGTIPNPTPEAT